MEVAEVFAVCDRLSQAGVWWCLQGGWGVDALLGEVTRDHKDLDLMVHVPTVGAVESLLEELGYRFAYVWPENEMVECDGVAVRTAFVFGEPSGREVDIHAGWALEDGGVRAAWGSGYTFPADDVSAFGAIAGRPMRCLSVSAQLRAHEGYELPATHAGDVERLRAAFIDSG